MTPIGDFNGIPPQLAAAMGPGAESTSTSLAPKLFSLRSSSSSADELRKQFTQFVGETFYGQMIKAMQTTVGKPAYFHGGRAEEVFQGQLNQQLAEQMTETTAAKLAEPLFERQFPHLAKQSPANDLNQLEQLTRR